MIRLKATVLALLALATPVAASTCEDVTFDGAGFTICAIDPSTEHLRLFLRDANGNILGSFARVDQALGTYGLALGVAMNAGMYHANRDPVGLYVEDGAQERGIVTSAGPGNFGMLPNGVLCLNDGRADVIESRAFRDSGQTCRFATQSGPMLVIDGALHPRFLPDSTSRYLRNGVGVGADGTVYLAISENPVRFHLFGLLFRDHLQTPNALYLDGKISKLHAPELGRSDGGLPMGPILGTVVPLDDPASAQ